MKWKVPPPIKVYEAIGTIGDDRMEINGNTAKVYSSSRGKFYTVTYDPERHAIMVNDNGSYYGGYLGYPAIAYLMKIGAIRYTEAYALALKGVPWKDINVANKNNFEKTAAQIHKILESKWISVESFAEEVESILTQIEALDLSLLGEKAKPPAGY